jgi:hypothetical protein
MFFICQFKTSPPKLVLPKLRVLNLKRDHHSIHETLT